MLQEDFYLVIAYRTAWSMGMMLMVKIRRGGPAVALSRRDVLPCLKHGSSLASRLTFSSF